MEDDKYFWDFSKEPGTKLNNKYTNTNLKPLVTIITSYYNGNKHIDQTINCVLNQTFPFWEWIIVDDGSTEKEAIDYLEKIKQIDNRIKIYKKENEGLAKGRDYAIKYSTTNYILPLDDDDLIEETYIETLYWTLETNKDAAWAFTNSVGFGKWLYLSNKKFDSQVMKNENQITATALIRKDEIINLGGYSIAKRYVNEDWHLWLRLLANGKYPVQATYYGFWYRRRNESLLTEINDEKKKENELRLRDLKKEADKITRDVNAIIYENGEFDGIIDLKNGNNKKTNIVNDLEFPECKKNTILYIIPNTGMCNKTFEKIKEQTGKNIIIVALEKTNQTQYALRQQYEEFATVYNLTTFLSKDYYKDFIEYLIITRNIKDIYIAEALKDKVIIEDSKYIEYKEDEKKYSKKIRNYKLAHTIVGRAIRKLGRIMK